MFTTEEDKIIRKMVAEIGEHKWSLIAKELPGKNRKQIRDHYINFLKLGQKGGRKFAEIEDQAIVDAVTIKGYKWTAIAKLLLNRSPIEVKNRFYGKLKREYHFGANPNKKVSLNAAPLHDIK